MAERELRALTAAEVRREREAELGVALHPKGDCPELLLVGLDGGWVPSREQAGGMEGKVGVVASEVTQIGQGRNQLSRRRYGRVRVWIR